jgi:hypothetical protein
MRTREGCQPKAPLLDANNAAFESRLSVNDPKPPFLTRFVLAFAVFFRLLRDAAFAGNVKRMATLPVPAEPEPTPAPEPPPPAPKLHQAETDAALQLLALLQREGRLLDFLEEDVSGYSDAEIGAAARVVHDDCRKALREHLTLVRIRTEEEGSRVVLEKGFDAGEVRLVGHVVGEAPFTGTLAHAGWRVSRIELPKLSEGHDVRVVAQAEVEL